jgi:nickel-dependent lactate racemase
MPIILDHLRDAGIAPEDITIVVGTGTHGEQERRFLYNKLGRQAMDTYRVLIHDDTKNTKRIGTTSFGTPVHVNREVIRSDLVIGIGGIYPQHTTGFGGGAKLALGVLGRRSIVGLHYGHPSVQGRYDINNDFRKDVTEMARMIGLNTIFALHVDAYLEVVEMTCGDHYHYYDKAAEFSRHRYRADFAEDADVVIVNAYPIDSFLEFLRKSFGPLVSAPRSAMKILIASAHEGVGSLGIFSHGFSRPSRWSKLVHMQRMFAVHGVRKIIGRINKRFQRTAPKLNYKGKTHSNGQSVVMSALPRNTERLWVYRTTTDGGAFPVIDGIVYIHSWYDVFGKIIEKLGERDLKVRIYSCGPLQTLE